MQILRKWTKTYDQLSKTSQEDGAEPKDLETLGLAAYLTGRDAESFRIMERAHQGYLQQQMKQQAVRCAFWLGLMLMHGGEKARSSGWIARGERLHHEEQKSDSAEKGLFLIPAALGKLGAGDAVNAQQLFEQVATIGEQFGDADLIALGRLGQGQAMIQQGEIAKGIKLLDETMIIVETEEVFPVVNGIVYCAVIETCRKVWDLRRAQEWTTAFTRWCDAQPDIVPFRGQCLVCRAEIIQLHGEWPKALEEIEDACKLLTRVQGEPAAGEAYYRKAELCRLFGEFKEAEDSYRQASRLGRKPQPGLALLRLAQGQNDAAETSIRNTLKETNDIKRRAEILSEFVCIMVAVKQIDEAREASKELDDIANKLGAPYLHAVSSHCMGTVFFAEGKVHLALEHLEDALKLWNSLHLPYEAARSRELKGLIYQELNDRDSADIELAAAKWVFEQLKAIPDLERVKLLLNKRRDHGTYGLTLRERQVLRLVTSGKTNKSVADELFISERTVDRHVSNIFNKLGVSSRVEATTFALKNGILG